MSRPPSVRPAAGPTAAPPSPDGDRAARGDALQPWLHDLVAALAPPVQLWCGPDGEIRPGGAQGAWCGDVRVLSACVATVGGHETAPVLATADGTDGQRVVSVARALGDGIDEAKGCVGMRM